MGGKKRNRCRVCGGKGLTNIVCKCGLALCLAHCQREVHGCKFDWSEHDRLDLDSKLPKLPDRRVEQV